MIQAIVPEFNALTTANPTEASRANLLFGDPSGSLIMSMLQLCIPGILLNLNKMREIECTYLYCLKTQIPAGVPPRACTIQRSYSWCMFVWGEIFSLIPFSNLIRAVLEMIMKILTDPATFIGILVGLICGNATVNEVIVACDYAKLITDVLRVIELVKSLENIGDQFNFESTGMCELALEDE